ncbi:hypothetical protein V8C26DRAFT_403731 [Trichoderma gracile]
MRWMPSLCPSLIFLLLFFNNRNAFTRWLVRYSWFCVVNIATPWPIEVQVQVQEPQERANPQFGSRRYETRELGPPQSTP